MPLQLDPICGHLATVSLARRALLSYELNVDNESQTVAAQFAPLAPCSAWLEVNSDTYPQQADTGNARTTAAKASVPDTSLSPRCSRFGSQLARIGYLALPAIALALTVWNVFLFYVLATYSPRNDFGRMYFSARAFWNGQDMYCWNPATPAYLGPESTIELWNLNPPHLQLVLLPFSLLPFSVALASWCVFSVGGLILCLRWILAELQLKLAAGSRLLALTALLAFTGTNSVILTGQLTFVLLVPLTLAWLAARQSRWTQAGFLLGIIMSVKPFLLLFVPYFLWRRRWRGLAACASAVGLSFSVGLVFFGVQNYVSWQRCLAVADQWAWLPMNASLLGALTRTFEASAYFAPVATLSPENTRAAGIVVGLAMGLLSLAASLRDRSAGEVDRSFALLLTASILLSPLGWTYYFWLPLGPIVAVLVGWKRNRNPTLLAAAGQVLWWVVFAGLFWPVQLNQLFQPAPWATVCLGNIFFWVLLGIWLGLLLGTWAAGRNTPWATMRARAGIAFG